MSDIDIKIETSTKSAEKEIKKYDNKIESLKRLEIEISQKRSEKDVVIVNDTLPDYRNIVDEAKINLSGYSKWQPYSTLLQRLNSPLSHDEKYAFRKSFEYLDAARKSEGLSDLAFEAFTGWKVSEKSNDKIAALEYYSKFLLLKGIDEIGKNYINARLFLAESIKTQHKLIGIVEESQKLRDLSTAILLYSYLIEHGHAEIADKVSFFDSTFAQYSFNSTLESLISHNMFSQVTLLIDDLCFIDYNYPLQIFADHIVNDKALFEKSFNLLISRISTKNKNLIRFLLYITMRHYKDTINLKKLQEKTERCFDLDLINNQKVAEEHVQAISNISYASKDQHEKIIMLFKRILSKSEDGSSKPISKASVTLRNLTTHLPLRSKTSLVIEVRNNSSKSIANCRLRTASAENQIIVKTPVVPISSLQGLYSMEFEIPLEIEHSFYYKSQQHKQTSFKIQLETDEDGEWQQLALVANSNVTFYNKPVTPLSYFTDGTPKQLDRNMVFGREKQFRDIEMAFQGQQSDRTLMLYGERGIGKTTLWKCLAQDYFSKHYHVIDIDIQSFLGATEKSLYKK